MQTAQPQQIAILGAGAIGQLIFHQLSQDASSPHLFGRQSQKRLLSFTNIAGNSLQRQIRLASAQDEALLSKLDLLIICVKAHQVVEAVTPLFNRLNPQCHLLLLHNGLGPHLELIPLLQGRGLSLGTTSQGALRQQAWQLLQTGEGITQLGHYCGPQMPLAIRERLLSQIPNSQWCEPILPMLWQKLAINVAINPLTALFNCRNGELAKAEHRPLIESLLAEVFKVAEQENIPLDREALTQRVFDVIQLTANNYSSMHQDIAHGRKTELDAITGYVIQRGAHHGIATPENSAIYQKMCMLSASSSKV
ncbi:2-dehydropantoate 2-reductase [Shewanella sp. Isolate11]|uniref:ketopantoate reductase family protein n=1 Tax=Shewanella sp. Isolate11 TaxID=2908530 RepID=UPI001EFD8903|nr:2-dehydropantoate 2-reductase [Shewanella sp. Isolate11]MCG9697387.1 2-dehydropantoate 2-reductase [Shewanella sp. Isolate11]